MEFIESLAKSSSQCKWKMEKVKIHRLKELTSEIKPCLEYELHEDAAVFVCSLLYPKQLKGFLEPHE